ncbi:MAG: SPOR domain-containing protein [Gammaproteobacteria bacterium]|jgi:DedD protein
MDRGLQERLVGAAVLVALGVWLIPWVLDGSAVNEQGPEAAVALKLPAPAEAGGTVVRRQTIDLSAERGAPVKRPAEPAATDQDAAIVPEDPPERTAAPAPEVPEVTEPAPVRAPADAPSPGAAQADVAAPESSASLPDIIAATPVAGWMVQLGSFSDAGNARRQAQRVGTFGHDAQIYEFAAAGGRTMFRVRLGPLDTRERAEAAASSLAAHGFVAQLVAPE